MLVNTDVDVRERVEKHLAGYWERIGSPMVEVAVSPMPGVLRVVVIVQSLNWDVMSAVVSAIGDVEDDLELVIDLDVQLAEPATV